MEAASLPELPKQFATLPQYKESIMGYSFGWNSKKEIVEYLTQPFGEVEKSTNLEHSCSGNILWSVIERVNSETGSTE